MNAEKAFTPALGNARFTPLYDFAIAAATREASGFRDITELQVIPTATGSMSIYRAT